MLLCIACFADFAGNTQLKMMKVAATTVFRIAVLATILWVVLADSRPGPGSPDFEKWKDMLKNVSESRGPGECSQISFLVISPHKTCKSKMLRLITHTTHCIAIYVFIINVSDCTTMVVLITLCHCF